MRSHLMSFTEANVCWIKTCKLIAAIVPSTILKTQEFVSIIKIYLVSVSLDLGL